MIEPKKKPCKGTGIANGYGCGVPTLHRVYGLGKMCGCYSDWLLNSEQGKIKLFKQKLNKHSEKRKIQNNVYLSLRKVFLNKHTVCPITNQVTTDIHHMAGRIGDLLNDTKHWLAVSREGHIKIENNPEWAKEKGYSLTRTNK